MMQQNYEHGTVTWVGKHMYQDKEVTRVGSGNLLIFLFFPFFGRTLFCKIF